MTLEDWLKQHFKTDDVKSALKQIGHIKYDLPINEELTKTIYVEEACFGDFLHWHVKYIDMSQEFHPQDKNEADAYEYFGIELYFQKD